MQKMDDLLKFHSSFSLGRWSTKLNYKVESLEELSRFYSPGIAVPCLEIINDPKNVFQYTGIGNSVAVITNGTAVLGLGNIGPLASKPVMESKAALFKRCAGINAVDIQVDTQDIDVFVDTISLIAKSFGGINLEDVSSPACFEIEKRLQERLDIPVFHDDQHGTAIAVLAAIINAFKVTGKDKNLAKVVIFGAGAAGIATGRILLYWGIKHIVMFDSKGVINSSRGDLNIYKSQFASDYDNSVDAFADADVLIGLSSGNSITQDMIMNMNKNPIFFTLSNPDPDISSDKIREIYPDSIIATGSYGALNQINNLLVFPYIFRAALDVRAGEINNEMKIAAAYSIANMVDQSENLSKSIKYMRIIPGILDENLLYQVSSAVMQAARNSGIANREISNYQQHLSNVLSK